MDALHITEIEFVRDVREVLARLRAGDEVVIEGGDRPLVLRAEEQARGRTVGDAIAGFKAYEAEHGEPLLMDDGTPRTCGRSSRIESRSAHPHGTDSRHQHCCGGGT